MSNRSKNKILRYIIRSTALQQAVFWILSYYILLNIFSLSSSIQRIDLIYTGIFIISLAIPVLVNLYFCIPLLLQKDRYLSYALTFLVLLFTFAWLNQVLFERLVDYIFPGYFFISFYSYSDLLKFFLVFLGITTLLKLSKEWFELNAARQDMLILEKEKVAAELKALANQVNPHFLFNSLNVIYSLVINQRKESSEAILKLSDILRYVIYGSSGPSVTLEEEIQLIRNYIDLQRFRVGEESRISFKVSGLTENLNIAPMLLLPLVENGFKHGIKGDIENTFLDITLTVENSRLLFSVENNSTKNNMQKESDTGGVGLENIRNRLNIMYQECYSLVIEDDGQVFSVELVIKDITCLKSDSKYLNEDR